MEWTPYREKLRTTLMRTVGIAVVVGGAFAWRARSLELWPVASLLALWVSLGGHWIEIFFLNWLRPRISGRRIWQVCARLAMWLAGGVLLGLAIAMSMRALALASALGLSSIWLAGPAFVAIELIAHAALALGRRPNFYDGRG